MARELTNEEKWADVDAIVRRINERKDRGDNEPCVCDMEEYINYHYNKGDRQDD